MKLNKEKDEALQELRSQLIFQKEAALQEQEVKLNKEKDKEVLSAKEVAEQDAETILQSKQEELDELNQTLSRIKNEAELAASAADNDKNKAAADCLNKITSQVDRCNSKVGKLRRRLAALMAKLEDSDPEDKAAAAGPAAPGENKMIPKRTREEYVYKPSTLMF